jgi:hypothetical protein
LSNNVAAAIRVVAVLGALACFSFQACAQTGQPFTAKQCSDAISIANAVVQSYKGQLSKDLIDSFVRFGRSNCDLSTTFTRIEGTSDEKAFGEFRVRLVALRMTDSQKK